MHHAVLVGEVQLLGDLPRRPQRLGHALVGGLGTPSLPIIRQRFALDEFNGQHTVPAVVGETQVGGDSLVMQGVHLLKIGPQRHGSASGGKTMRPPLYNPHVRTDKALVETVC